MSDLWQPRQGAAPAKQPFYLSKLELNAGDGPGMRRWRKRLFLATGLAAADPGDYFRLPRERTITIGSEIEF
jgi:KUP system potassium uptake protein